MDKRIARKFETKIKVLTHYGKGKCACVFCGFDDIRALSIDHINGREGYNHHKRIGGDSLYRWLLKNKLPEGFQTLCMNCQFIKRYESDLPQYSGMRSNKLSVRLRTWIEQRKQQFYYNDIRAGLDLTPKEYNALRVLLHNMVKRGEIIRVRDGCFKKAVKPIDIFAYRTD